MGSHPLLQGIFPVQGSNPDLLHCRQILYHLSHHRSTLMDETCVYTHTHTHSHIYTIHKHTHTAIDGHLGGFHILVVANNTPKQTGDRSSDLWTRRDLRHPGDVNLELTNAPTSPCYTILMLLMIVSCIINCLICFVSAQVNKLQHAVPVQQRYKTTADHGKHHSPLDGHCYKDSEVWD